MTEQKIYDEPSDIDAEDGVVSIAGPDEVHVKLTPDAARETSDRLLEKAMKAQGQKIRDEAARRGIRQDKRVT